MHRLDMDATIRSVVHRIEKKTGTAEKQQLN